MTTDEINIILAVISMAVQYGVPAVQTGIILLNKDAVTLEDIQGLKGLIKPPEEY